MAKEGLGIAEDAGKPCFCWQLDGHDGRACLCSAMPLQVPRCRHAAVSTCISHRGAYRLLPSRGGGVALHAAFVPSLFHADSAFMSAFLPSRRGGGAAVQAADLRARLALQGKGSSIMMAWQRMAWQPRMAWHGGMAWRGMAWRGMAVHGMACRAASARERCALHVAPCHAMPCHGGCLVGMKLLSVSHPVGPRCARRLPAHPACPVCLHTPPTPAAAP